MRIHERTQCVSAEEKLLCRSPIHSGHMSAICAVPSKGKGEIHKRVENRSFSRADFSQPREMFSIVTGMSFSAFNSADNVRF